MRLEVRGCKSKASPRALGTNQREAWWRLHWRVAEIGGPAINFSRKFDYFLSQIAPELATTTLKQIQNYSASACFFLIQNQNLGPLSVVEEE